MRDDTELEELNLEEEDEPDYEAGNDYGDDWEGGSPLKPGMVAIIFGILVILAAIICGILWRVTHADTPEGQNNASTWQLADNGSAGEDQSLPDTDATPDGETMPGGSEPTVTPEPEPEVTATPEPTPEVTATPEPTPEITATPEPTPEITATPQPAATQPSATADPNRVPTKDGRVIVFTDCDDFVTPKEYVNLRLEPSTSEGNATIHCRLNYGETVHRTGISEDSGWSRVEKDGVVCYVVTSLVYVPE
mgnify:FL=1